MFLIPIPWIVPKNRETIKAYAQRLFENVNLEEPYGILGVSFGGLVAVEASKIHNPGITILISTVEVRSELRLIYRLIGQTRIINVIPSHLFSPPKLLAYWLFSTKSKSLLDNILDDTDPKFAKWAIGAFISWQNQERISSPLLKIGSTTDRLIPAIGDQTLVKGGGHFMIVDKAEEISEIINRELEVLSPGE